MVRKLYLLVPLLVVVVGLWKLSLGTPEEHAVSAGLSVPAKAPLTPPVVDPDRIVAGEPTGPSPDPDPPAPQTFSADDRKAAEAVTVEYFRHLAAKEYYAAAVLRSSQSHNGVSDQTFAEAVKAVTQLELTSISADDAHPHTPYSLQFGVVLVIDAESGKTAWTQGKNVRWVGLVKEGAEWRIDAVAT